MSQNLTQLKEAAQAKTVAVGFVSPGNGPITTKHVNANSRKSGIIPILPSKNRPSESLNFKK